MNDDEEERKKMEMEMEMEMISNAFFRLYSRE